MLRENKKMIDTFTLRLRQPSQALEVLDCFVPDMLENMMKMYVIFSIFFKSRMKRKRKEKENG